MSVDRTVIRCDQSGWEGLGNEHGPGDQGQRLTEYPIQVFTKFTV